MPEIAFLMGKSSSGKDNIFKALVGDKELNLKTVIMYTTRPPEHGYGCHERVCTDRNQLYSVHQ